MAARIFSIASSSEHHRKGTKGAPPPENKWGCRIRLHFPAGYLKKLLPNYDTVSVICDEYWNEIIINSAPESALENWFKELDTSMKKHLDMGVERSCRSINPSFMLKYPEQEVDPYILEPFVIHFSLNTE